MATYQDFWGGTGDFLKKAGPGMLDFGLGMYSKNAAQKEAAQRLAQAQGPIYQQATNAASGMLTSAGGFDPNAFAADRFKQQQALLDPVYAKQTSDLMSTLRGRGQLGIATYNPGVEGITPNGTAMNPQLAALFAAQNAQRSKDAYGSLDQGQQYLDKTLDRAGMLQRTAANAQDTGLQAARTQPSRAAANAELLKGGVGVLKDAGVLKDIFSKAPGMISSGVGWLKDWWNGGPSLLGGFDTSSDFSWV